MSFLPDVFVDPALRARQDTLNAQWISLYSLSQTCGAGSDALIPDSAWVEFVNDYKGWQDFYASESDWTISSKQATDTYQSKAQEWAKRLSNYGCGGTLGSVGGVNIITDAEDLGIPGVKDNPPDPTSLWSQITGGITSLESSITAPLKSFGIGVAILLIVLLAGIGYILTRGKASGYGVSVG